MSTLPAFLLSRKPRGLAAAAVQGIGGASSPHISISDNRFTLVDGAGNARPVKSLELDVVIVDVNPAVSKLYFDQKYDPKATEVVRPACFSDNGVGPSSQALNPQHPVCATCAHNQWGSARSNMTGKDTKACNDVKKIAVIAPGYDDKLVFLLRVPPATLKNFKAYAQKVSSGTVGDRPIDLSDLVTRVSFASQGVLDFEPVDFIDEAVAARVAELDDGVRTAEIVGRNDVPAQGLIAGPRPGSSIAAAPVAEVAQEMQRMADPAPAPAGKGRPKGSPNKPKEPEAAPAVQPPAKPFFAAPKASEAPLDESQVPAFLRKTPPVAAADTEVKAPDPQLSAALAAAFGLPT